MSERLSESMGGESMEDVQQTESETGFMADEVVERAGEWAGW